jgi:CheY-like chemotaxis protein
LKKGEVTKVIPVVVITANGHHVARKESEQSGAAVFLTKPFSPMQLLTEIRRILPPDGKTS